MVVTGRMDIDVSLVEDCRRLAKQCKMADVIEELENKCKHVYEFGKTVVHFYTLLMSQSLFKNLQHIKSGPTLMVFIMSEISLSLFRLPVKVSNKPGICVKVLSLESPSCQIQEDMAQLADCALPTELRVRTR